MTPPASTIPRSEREPERTTPDDDLLFEERVRRTVTRILKADALRHGLDLGGM